MGIDSFFHDLNSDDEDPLFEADTFAIMIKSITKDQ